MLVGYKVHHIKAEDLPWTTAKETAQHHWLPDKWYLAILANPDHYNRLRSQDLGAINIDGLLHGTEDRFFMCHRDHEDHFDYDVTERYDISFEDVQIPRLNVLCEYTMELEKREYTMRYNDDVKLVHYQLNDNDGKRDKARALVETQELRQEINQHGDSSRQSKQGILQNIRGFCGRGRGGN